MHPITDVADIDQRMLAEQIAEANRFRPFIWLLVFLAPLGLLVGLAFGIWLGGN